MTTIESQPGDPAELYRLMIDEKFREWNEMPGAAFLENDQWEKVREVLLDLRAKTFPETTTKINILDFLRTCKERLFTILRVGRVGSNSGTFYLVLRDNIDQFGDSL